MGMSGTDMGSNGRESWLTWDAMPPHFSGYSPHASPLSYAYYYEAAFHTTWYLGVLLSILSSFAGALGDNLVRLSYVYENGKLQTNRREIWQRPLWLAGEFLVVFVNPCFSIISLKVAAASIVLPFAGLHIFWNVVLASKLLRERIGKLEVFGSLVILVGIILVVSFGVHKVPAYNMEKMLSLLEQPVFLMYSFGVFILCSICCYLSYLSPGLKFVKCAKGREETTYSKIGITAASGIFGGMGNILAKSSIEILNSDGLFACLSQIKFHVLTFFIVFCCGCQLFCLNLALYRYEAKQVVPMVNAALVACGSIGGLLLFEEYLHMSQFDFYAFCLGVFTVVVGLLILINAGEVNEPSAPSRLGTFHDDERTCLTAGMKCVASSNFSSLPYTSSGGNLDVAGRPHYSNSYNNKTSSPCSVMYIGSDDEEEDSNSNSNSVHTRYNYYNKNKSKSKEEFDYDDDYYFYFSNKPSSPVFSNSPKHPPPSRRSSGHTCSSSFPSSASSTCTSTHHQTNNCDSDIKNDGGAKQCAAQCSYFSSSLPSSSSSSSSSSSPYLSPPPVPSCAYSSSSYAPPHGRACANTFSEQGGNINDGTLLDTCSSSCVKSSGGHAAGKAREEQNSLSFSSFRFPSSTTPSSSACVSSLSFSALTSNIPPPPSSLSLPYEHTAPWGEVSS